MISARLNPLNREGIALLWNLLLLLVGLIIVAALVLMFGPRPSLNFDQTFDDSVLGDDLDAYLAREEARFPDIRDGLAKQIHWAGQPGAQTEIALVYLHGFSASAREISPVLERVGSDLRANVYFTRLAGHARTGAAMGEVSTDDWFADLAETMAIGRRLGRRVVIVGTSTGAALGSHAPFSARLREDLAGLVLISPNFKPAAKGSGLLTLAFARQWVPLVLGDTRSVVSEAPDHPRYWTTSYPTVSLVPMAHLARSSRELPFAEAKTPALFLYSPQDRVIRPDLVEDVAAKWGGPVTKVKANLRAGDDTSAHVIAGDAFSPGQNDFAVETISGWIKALPSQ